MNAFYREKIERKDDPNVEYIDVEDYKPGGKYGPPLIVKEDTKLEPQSEELRKASEVIASSVANKVSIHLYIYSLHNVNR